MNEWEELTESLGLTPAKGYTPSPAFESLDRLIRVVRLPKGGALPEPPEPEVYLLYAGVLICAVERAGGEAFIDNILWKPGTMYFDIHRVAGDACPVRTQVIAAEPERLTEVSGIGKKKAEMIHLSYMEQFGLRKAMVFLQGFGVSPALSVKIARRYQDRTETVLRENPYRLIDDLEGVGFITADRIAAALGLEEDSVFRKRWGKR